MALSRGSDARSRDSWHTLTSRSVRDSRTPAPTLGRRHRADVGPPIPCRLRDRFALANGEGTGARAPVEQLIGSCGHRPAGARRRDRDRGQGSSWSIPGPAIHRPAVGDDADGTAGDCPPAGFFATPHQQKLSEVERRGVRFQCVSRNQTRTQFRELSFGLIAEVSK